MAAGVLVHELRTPPASCSSVAPPNPSADRLSAAHPHTPSPAAAPVTASAYRAAGLLPALVLGGLPLLAAWATGSAGLLLWAWVMLALAGGDVAAVWAMRSVPGDAMVVDDPALVGCRRV
jgi:hypothetical protein